MNEQSVFQITEKLLDRAKLDWIKIAKEEIEIEYIPFAIYAMGSELAILRLVAAYRNIPTAHYQINTRCLFSLDISECFK